MLVCVLPEYFDFALGSILLENWFWEYLLVIAHICPYRIYGKNLMLQLFNFLLFIVIESPKRSHFRAKKIPGQQVSDTQLSYRGECALIFPDKIFITMPTNAAVL